MYSRHVHWKLTADGQPKDQIGVLVDTATFYDALPMCRLYIEANLWRFDTYRDGIPESCHVVLAQAFALRSALLFREAFIHVCGKWAIGEGERSQLRRYLSTRPCGKYIIPVIERHHCILRDHVSEVTRKLIGYTCGNIPENHSPGFKEALAVATRQKMTVATSMEDKDQDHKSEAMVLNDFITAPCTFSDDSVRTWAPLKQLQGENKYQLNKRLRNEIHQAFLNVMEPLFTSMLVIDTKLELGNDDINYFLCTDLQDCDLPWRCWDEGGEYDSTDGEMEEPEETEVTGEEETS